MPFTQMLLHCFRQSERTYGMFYLASNIGYVSDPYYDYHTADEYQGHRNTTGLRDVTLMKLEHDMQKAHPLEMREYTEKWLAFQKRWVELDANNAALLERLLRFLRKQSDGLQHRI